MKNINLLFLFIAISLAASAQDSLYVKAHFLCGSKPKRPYKKTESHWFGGKLGGHAGIEIAPNYIIDFVPAGKFHIFSHRNKRHSRFTTHDTLNFYNLFGAKRDSVQRMSITIPITQKQKNMLDSLSKLYLEQTPYDYAFFGMRCGAAAYDVLSYTGILKQHKHMKTAFKIFYPRKLRRKLMKKAKANHWKIYLQQGSQRRKWERI